MSAEELRAGAVDDGGGGGVAEGEGWSGKAALRKRREDVDETQAGRERCHAADR